MLRSRWTILYGIFFLLSTLSLFYFSGNLTKSIVSLMNVTLTIIPLISIAFGVMYYYNSREFIDLLLSQPVSRKSVFMGQYFGLAFSLSLSFIFGTLIPYFIYGVFVSADIWNFLILLVVGVLLTFIFVALAYFITIRNDDKIKGFGLAILVWLYLAVIYDGLMLLFFISFNDYPLEKASILLTVLNPIDLSRVLVLLKLDISALMGYTGAVFNQFFGTTKGMIISLTVMVFWWLVPLAVMIRTVGKKDF
jgi:Cu-processing system permease protein